MQPKSDATESGQPDAKALMIDVAEKLIAERGLDNVSMRDVATVAGQRNNSAVQYHFGSRDGLIMQILRRRLIALDNERQRRLAVIDEMGLGTDLSSLVGVVFGPIVDLLRDNPDARHYGRFLQRVGPVMAPGIPETGLRTSSDDVVVRLIDSMSHLPRRVAFERIDLATQMFTGALAVYEDRRDASNIVVNSRFEDVVAHLYDMVEASLLAGVSAGGQSRFDAKVAAEAASSDTGPAPGGVDSSGADSGGADSGRSNAAKSDVAGR